MTEKQKAEDLGRTVGFTAKVSNGGHFEKGRWVNMFTPLLDYLVDIIDIDQPEFEIFVKGQRPIFRVGACIGYVPFEKSLGIFTQREVLQMLPARFGGHSTFPEDAELRRVIA